MISEVIFLKKGVRACYVCGHTRRQLPQLKTSVRKDVESTNCKHTMTKTTISRATRSIKANGREIPSDDCVRVRLSALVVPVTKKSEN